MLVRGAGRGGAGSGSWGNGELEVGNAGSAGKCGAGRRRRVADTHPLAPAMLDSDPLMNIGHYAVAGELENRANGVSAP